MLYSWNLVFTVFLCKLFRKFGAQIVVFLQSYGSLREPDLGVRTIVRILLAVFYRLIEPGLLG